MPWDDLREKLYCCACFGVHLLQGNSFLGSGDDIKKLLMMFFVSAAAVVYAEGKGVAARDLLGGEIAEDLAAYFVESEQIPTACGLGVLVDRDQSVRAAGGYLIQLLPGADEDTIVKVEGGIMAAGSVSSFLEKDDDPEHLLRHVMSDFDLKVFDATEVEYRCYCSRERVEKALVALGKEELEKIIAEQGGCEMTCQFCDAVYKFTAEDLEKLIKEM